LYYVGTIISTIHFILHNYTNTVTGRSEVFSDSTLGISLSTFLEMGLKPADVGIAASFCYVGQELFY